MQLSGNGNRSVGAVRFWNVRLGGVIIPCVEDSSAAPSEGLSRIKILSPVKDTMVFQVEAVICKAANIVTGDASCLAGRTLRHFVTGDIADNQDRLAVQFEISGHSAMA